MTTRCGTSSGRRPGSSIGEPMTNAPAGIRTKRMRCGSHAQRTRRKQKITDRRTMISMRGYAKAGIVIGGYVLAFAIASAAVALHMATTNQADASAASGMYAFGDTILFVAVFGVVALVPT